MQHLGRLTVLVQPRCGCVESVIAWFYFLNKSLSLLISSEICKIRSTENLIWKYLIFEILKIDKKSKSYDEKKSTKIVGQNLKFQISISNNFGNFSFESLRNFSEFRQIFRIFDFFPS